ncbi:hypothetical protein [Geminocystis sp.]|uniref:hypothetical protein n=1 Tax=Geminocystis sp. TaxID=2664100 RepID=UPI0035938C1F
MKKLSTLVISSLFLLTSCTTSGGGGEDNTANIPPIPPQKPPVNTTETPTTPVVIAETNTTSGLIPSTNPDDRLRKIEQGRNDPFNTITPPAVIKLTSNQPISSSQAQKNAILKPPSVVKEEITKANKGVVNQPLAKNITASNSQNSQNIVNKTVSQTGKTSNLSPSPNNINNISSIATPPPLPSPNDAQNIIVSGILNLNGENVALIKTPWDNVTRSVRVGELISDNSSGIRVRVKAISFGYPTTIALRENNETVLRSINNDSGVVILEQFTQTVTRKIGEKQTDKVAKL